MPRPRLTRRVVGGSRPRDPSGAAASRGIRLAPALLERTEQAAELARQTWSAWAVRALDAAAAAQGAPSGPASLDDVLAYVAAERPPGHQAELVAAIGAVLTREPRALRGAIGVAWAGGLGAELVRVCEAHTRMTEE